MERSRVKLGTPVEGRAGERTGMRSRTSGRKHVLFATQRPRIFTPSAGAASERLRAAMTRRASSASVRTGVRFFFVADDDGAGLGGGEKILRHVGHVKPLELQKLFASAMCK